MWYDVGMQKEDDVLISNLNNAVVIFNRAGISHARIPNVRELANILSEIAAEVIEKGSADSFLYSETSRRGINKLVFTREYFLRCISVTGRDIESLSEEDKKEVNNCLDEASKFFAETQQEKISITLLEKSILDRASAEEEKEWSAYTVHSALVMATLSSRLSDARNRSLRVDEIASLAIRGKLLHEAFTPEEVKQAMDKAGISPSQAVTLMAELERLRDARMNPDGSGNTLPE